MPGFQQNLRGRTVYSGGSFAPTRGPVSASGVQGYLRREMGNRGVFGGVSKFGRDGQSDTRSGVAKRALDSRWAGNYGLPTEGHNQRDPRGGAKPNKPKPGIQGSGAPVGGAAAPAAPAPATPSVTVNDAGQLELPYDPAWGQEVLTDLEDTNSALAALQQQQQAQAQAYAQNKKAAGEGYVTQQRDTLNDNAARGVAFSSGYGVAVGRDANDYQNLVNQLDSDNAQANAGFDFDRTTITNAFKNRLRQASLDYGNTLAEDAGSYGYGQPVTGSGGGHGGGGGKNKPKNNGGGGGNKPKPAPVKPNKPGGKKK